MPIPPVPPGPARPRWSVMIPTYNCASYLRETLASVLAQDPGADAMQIEVVDDASTDDPERVVAEVGGGRVAFHRQSSNVGHVRNFGTCLQRARGSLVHLLHGDDAVRPGFYATMARAFEASPEIGAAFCRQIIMDEDGHWVWITTLLQREPGVVADWLETIAAGQRLQAPAMVVRREVYERLGGFDERIERYGEDWEMWVRIAAHYPVRFEPEPLAMYRIHSSSLSGHTQRTGANMRDLARATAIVAESLPPDRAAHLVREATRNSALAATRRAVRMIHQGEMQAPLAQLREAVRLSRSPGVLARVAFAYSLWGARAVRSRGRPRGSSTAGGRGAPERAR